MAVAITIVVIAKIVKGVFTRGVYGLFRVDSPITGNIKVKSTSRTVKASGTVRVKRVRKTVDDLSVTISNLVAIIMSLVFSRVCWKKGGEKL